jgi:deoxyribonuclease (pyrimidine dimer)
MTRINCIPVEELSRQHLLAEYRELPRVYGLVRAAIARGEPPTPLSRYRMGQGHVRFFYTRLRWVARRHQELVDEMARRGYRAQYPPPSLEDFPESWCGDWEPEPRDLEISRSRIKERS